MDFLPPALLLLAALVCSFIGRAMVVRAAFGISKGWGLSVLCLPLAPLIFRLKHKELAHEGQLWGTATAIFAVLFFAVTGSTGLLQKAWQLVPEKMRPAAVAAYRAPAVSTQPEVAGAPEKPDGSDAPPPAVAVAPIVVPAPPVVAAKAMPAPEKKGFMARIQALVSPAAAIPAPQVSSAPAAPLPPTLPQRVAANQQEFARLSAVYESLKKERGYLKKWDHEAIAAYNLEAAKYQAALAAARAEQTELNKQLVAKK